MFLTAQNMICSTESTTSNVIRISRRFNSFYWDFFHRHRQRLGKNARVAMMYRVWDRLGSKEKKAVLNQAAAYRKKLNRL